MATTGYLERRANAAARRLSAAYPGLAVIPAALHTHSATISYVDGPAHHDAEKTLCRAYKVARLSAAHVAVRREYSLVAVITLLSTMPFPPASWSTFMLRAHKVDLRGPVEPTAVLLAQMLAPGGVEPGVAMITRYPQLRAQLTVDLAAAAAEAVHPANPPLIPPHA